MGICLADIVWQYIRLRGFGEENFARVLLSGVWSDAIILHRPYMYAADARIGPHAVFRVAEAAAVQLRFG